MISIDEMIETLALVLSCGYTHKFNGEVIEKRIANSSYFISIENSKENSFIYKTADSIVRNIYFDIELSNDDFKLYNQSLWLSELYIRIQKETKMTFEAIFIYLPIDKGYEMFVLYHEMDFSQAVDYFISLREKRSILSILMKNKGISIGTLSDASGLSYSMISSLKRREKDITKVSASNFIQISSYLGVRPETLLCEI